MQQPQVGRIGVICGDVWKADLDRAGKDSSRLNLEVRHAVE